MSASSIPRPLEQIKRETRRANRAPHLRKSAIPGPDTIDKLDNILGGIPYHHEGPFDATLMSRQIPGRSPVEALATSNAEAIAATPRANLIDSLERHRPLQGTASIPPGMRAPGGDILPYYEEYDVMTRDGNYKRYPGVVCSLLNFVFVVLKSNFVVRSISTKILRAKASPVIRWTNLINSKKLPGRHDAVCLSARTSTRCSLDRITCSRFHLCEVLPGTIRV